MMEINLWDYSKEYAELRDEILAAVDRVFASGRLILGEEVAGFEREFATCCGLSHPGVGVNSGTDALFIGLKALGIGAGDEVITVANTAVPTVAAIVSAGAKPRFVDIDPDSYLMDAAKLEATFNADTRCVLPVHLYGQSADMDAICAVARTHNLLVLEDCAQSTPAGGAGDIAAWSFYPTKLLGAYRDGGMITGANSELLDRARSLRMYGMKDRYYAEEHGYNSRLDEVQAAILRVKLSHLDDWVARRQELAERYANALAGCGLMLPKENAGNRHGWYVYVVRHPERDKIIAALADTGIGANISYPWPVHTMKAYENLGYAEGDLPVTEQMSREIFSLPMYPTLTDGQLDRVCDALKKIFKSL